MAIWIYDAAEDRLCSESNGDRTTVSLSPQQHRLVAYMAARNREARGKSVLCTREELIQAVWADEPDHLPQDLAYLVHQLRARLGPGVAATPLILNERGRGYRLAVIDPQAQTVPPPPPTTLDGSRRWLFRAAIGAAVALASGGAVFAASRPRPPEPILREGSHGDEVLVLQRELAEAGYDPVYLDGQFGPLTATAVRAFQQDNGLVVDGDVGPATRAALQRVRESQPARPTQR
jgi:DNA-binding winged helix-turn-helix (wHTH) protein